MKDPKKKPLTDLVLSPDVLVFRRLHEIQVGDDIMQSARERYLRTRETTFMLSSHAEGQSAYDVMLSMTKRNTDQTSQRRRQMLEKANAYQQAMRTPFKFFAQKDLPAERDDRLRLFIALRILFEPIFGQELVRQSHETARQMLLDLYPTAAIIHGSFHRRNPTMLQQFGVVHALPRAAQAA